MITDGAASTCGFPDNARPLLTITSADYDVLVQCIVDTARRLERSGVEEDKFGIQFVQIGTDVAAAESLRALDFDLESTYKIRVCVVRLVGVQFNPVTRTLWLLLPSTLVMASSTRSTCSRSSLVAFVKRLKVPRAIGPSLRRRLHGWHLHDQGL